MRNINKYLIIILLIVLAFLLGFFSSRIFPSLTGKAITEDEQETLKNYTWTKAICNSKNECVDVLITCENGKVKKIEPVSELVKIENLSYNSSGFC